jgi:hypothetical protein
MEQHEVYKVCLVTLQIPSLVTIINGRRTRASRVVHGRRRCCVYHPCHDRPRLVKLYPTR